MSVAVNDLNVTWAFIGPDEAQPPLLIDPDAVLALAVILERLKTIARRNLQVVKNRRPVKLRKFAQRRALEIHPPLDAFAMKQRLCAFALEASNRHSIIAT